MPDNKLPFNLDLEQQHMHARDNRGTGDLERLLQQRKLVDCIESLKKEIKELREELRIYKLRDNK